jgi:hypothetical protein
LLRSFLDHEWFQTKFQEGLFYSVLVPTQRSFITPAHPMDDSQFDIDEIVSQKTVSIELGTSTYPFVKCPCIGLPTEALNRSPHFIDRNCPQAVGLVKNAVIRTWPAPELRADHDAVMWAARAEPLWPLWAEDGCNWHLQQVC